MPESILAQLRAGDHDCTICGHTHRGPDAASSTPADAGESPAELIIAVHVHLEQLTSAFGPRMAERIKAGEGDDERVALLVKTTRALESALVTIDERSLLRATEWNVARLDGDTGELWNIVHEPLDSLAHARQILQEEQENSEPSDDQVVVVSRASGVEPGQWQPLPAEVDA